MLVYYWFYRHGIPFEIQPKVSPEECLKAKADVYEADGDIDGALFDVKTFSFGIPRYKEFEDNLNVMIEENKTKRLDDFIKEANTKLNSANIEDEIISELNDKIKNSLMDEYYVKVSGNANLSSHDYEKSAECEKR